VNPSLSNLGDQAVPITAATTTDLKPGRSVFDLTCAAAVTITALRMAPQDGRMVILRCKSGSFPITLTHTAIASQAVNKITLARRLSVTLLPGDAIILRQTKAGGWIQVGCAEPVYITSSSGGASRNIAHGLGYIPTVAAVSVTTAAGAIGAGWTLGAIDATTIAFTCANATDIVRLILLPGPTS
jgi:hypothetical protein